VTQTIIDPIARRIRVLIVDDERLARVGLRTMLAGDSQLLLQECAGGRDAARIITDEPIDLVFLDVRMPKVGGFDVIATIEPDGRPVLVMTTAYSEHALRAFDAHVLDYLLKPLSEARLARSVLRAKEVIRQRRLGVLHDALVASPPRPPRLLVRSGPATYYVDVRDVDWIEADAYYARLWTGSRSHLVRQSLTHLEAGLDVRQFVRIHRRAIVNVARVAEIRGLGVGRYGVVLTNGTRIGLSRKRREQLQAALRAVPVAAGALKNG
jgi:two-component system LytT family response regulator